MASKYTNLYELFGEEVISSKVNITTATPHFAKLVALQNHPKLPLSDVPILQDAVQKYQEWIAQLTEQSVLGNVSSLTTLLNEYKRFIDINVIYDSEQDFLYRWKGQSKLDNSVLEEFLPYLLYSYLPSGKYLGPQTTVVNLSFDENGNLQVVNKDQDFALAHSIDITLKTQTLTLTVAQLVIECKTNIDKTHYNECVETARSLKKICPTSSYFLISEWLDMEPVPTVGTPIDDVLILRKAKRLHTYFGDKLSSTETRKELRSTFLSFYDAHPIHQDCLERLVDRVKLMLSVSSDIKVFETGHF